MDVSATELGNAFVKTCFGNYQGTGRFLYLTALCFCLLLLQKKEEWRSFFGLYGGFLLLVVFNPFVIWRVVALLGLDDEYYRFLWLIPVAPVLAYTGTKLTEKAGKYGGKGAGILCLAGAACLFLAAGTPFFSRSLAIAENIYKIPDEVIEICEIIRADCPKEEPCVAADFDLDVLINQYAPDLRLILSYRAIADIRALEAQGDYIDEAPSRLYHVLIEETPHDEGYLIYALAEGNVDYIVTHRGTPVREYILESQCRLIAELDQYCIFRVERKQEVSWERNSDRI